MSIKPPDYQSAILSQKEIRRYALQISIAELGISGQEKLKQAKVLVIGAGGKGSSALENLASIGIGHIGICDNFPVQEGDLSRQHLYGNNDLGKQKAIIARQKLQEINPLVSYKLHNVCLNENNIKGIAESYDILIDATDNFAAHYLIDDAASSLKKPLIFGSIFGGLGYVSVFSYKEGPSLRDAYPQPVKEGEINFSNGFACQITLMSIIGAVIANETVKLALKLDTQLNGKILTIDSANYSLLFNEIN